MNKLIALIAAPIVFVLALEGLWNLQDTNPTAGTAITLTICGLILATGITNIRSNP